jgi:hypothetical protein
MNNLNYFYLRFLHSLLSSLCSSDKIHSFLWHYLSEYSNKRLAWVEKQAAVYDVEKFTLPTTLIYILIALVSLVLRFLIIILPRLFSEGTQTHTNQSQIGKQILRYMISCVLLMFCEIMEKNLLNSLKSNLSALE